jgi:hypothetical protein
MATWVEVPITTFRLSKDEAKAQSKVTGRYDRGTITTKELLDVDKYCRVKSFTDKQSGKIIGVQFCSEATGMFGTLIVYDLTIDDMKDLFRKSNVEVVDAHEDEIMLNKITKGDAKRRC